VLEDLINEWQDFRKALRKEDKAAFDRLMDKTRRHSSAASYGVRTDPIESLFMSILVKQEKEIEVLQQRMEELEKKK
jgi:hypothetical protein